MSGQPKKATMKDNYLGRVSSGLPLFFSFQIIHKRLNKLNLVFQNRDNVYSEKGVLVAAGIWDQDAEESGSRVCIWLPVQRHGLWGYAWSSRQNFPKEHKLCVLRSFAKRIRPPKNTRPVNFYFQSPKERRSPGTWYSLKANLPDHHLRISGLVKSIQDDEPVRER